MILTGLENNVRKFKIKNKSSPWVDEELLHQINIKNRLWKQAKHSKCINHWNLYKKHNIYVRNLSRRKYSLFLNEAFENIDNHPKKFVSFVKLKNGQGSIPPTVFYEDSSASSPADKAELFNNYFF